MGDFESMCSEPRTVLVVEDDPDIRELLADFLGEEGYPVVTASDGLEGLGVLSHLDRPGLVLLDMRMPVVDGREFVSILRDRGALGSLSVFLISALGDRPIPGTQGVIPKPIDLTDLLAVVRRTCGEGAFVGRA